MTPPRQLLVVAHTHWDREWYHAAPRFRQRLVRLIDELLDGPPQEGESFLLDGQAIVLEDYLGVRPERTAELATLLQQGRLEAGPWFVLADELIPGGEALVRNLLAGRDVMRRLGAESPPVLYCPDAFGHPASLPDLAAGFGCELVILWRGFGGRRWPRSDVALWHGSGGGAATIYHLSPDGYELGSSLSVEGRHAASRWTALEPALFARSGSGVALLLNGADHHARQRHQPAAVRALGDAAMPVAVRPVSLRAAAAALLAACHQPDLPVVEGELRDSYGYTWCLQGTLGSRAAQKRRNARAERRLVRDVEPWIALTNRGGDAATRALLLAAWRTLLAGHPHDTLCGTAIDDVADALDRRLGDAEVEARGLRDDSVRQLLGHDGEAARAAADEWRPAVVVRNRAPRARGGVVELRLRAKVADIAVGPGSADRQGVPGRAGALTVAGMPVQLLGRTRRVELTESPRHYPDADLVVEALAVGWTTPVRGLAVESREQSTGRPAGVPNPVRADPGWLDNGRLRVELSDAGGVRLHDRARARTIDALLHLEDAVDVGDLYTPAIRQSLPAAVVRRVRLVHRGPLRGELAIELVTPGRTRATSGHCTLRLSLDADAGHLGIALSGFNRAADHRLRLRIATGLLQAATLADAAFHPVARHALQIASEDAAMEQVVATAPLHRWVTRFSPTEGVTIVSDGLAEYESDADGSVAVTLVRSVGELSRPDLPERPGHAGWPASTPGAQSLGPFEARLAIALHGPDGPEVRDAIEQLADDVLLPLVGESLRSNLEPPHEAGGLELAGSGLVFSAAMPAREPGWVVLRCVNRRDIGVRGVWRTGRRMAEARRARMDETVLSPLDTIDADGRDLSFDAAPREIVTLLVRWAESS